MIGTPHDWKNGADYSDEFYENLEKCFENQKCVSFLLKVFLYIIIAAAITGLIIWQRENISVISQWLFKNIKGIWTIEPQKFIIIALFPLAVISVSLLERRKRKNKSSI